MAIVRFAVLLCFDAAICVANTVCAWTVHGQGAYCSLAAIQSNCETADTEASCIANPMCSWRMSQDVARCGSFFDNTPCSGGGQSGLSESVCADTLDCEWHAVSGCGNGCSDHGNESACASASCSWSGHCSDGSVDCGDLQDSGDESACSAHPSCNWDAGRCDSLCHGRGNDGEAPCADQAGCEWRGDCTADDPQSCQMSRDAPTCNSNAPCMWATMSHCVPPGFSAYWKGVQDSAICSQEKSEPDCTAVVITTTTTAVATTIAVATDPLGDRAIAGSLPSAASTTIARPSSGSADMGLRTGVVLVLSLITATLWN